jgi:hypothetical protein
MLDVDVGVKFRTLSVKCAKIFDQDCRKPYQKHEYRVGRKFSMLAYM